MPGRKASFWLAVALTGGVIGPVAVNLAADRLGDKVPGLRVLNDYTTRRNG